MPDPSWLNDIRFDGDGLIPAIAQDRDSGRVLMVGWMNRSTLLETVESRRAVYFSRSRQQRWEKGEQSGHTQLVHDIALDCDGDVLILTITQSGGIACHTGRASCFYRILKDGRWEAMSPVLKDPEEIYGQS